MKGFPSIQRKLASSNDAAKKNANAGTDVWITCFDKKVGDTLQILCGDSEGSLYTF